MERQYCSFVGWEHAIQLCACARIGCHIRRWSGDDSVALDKRQLADGRALFAVILSVSPLFRLVVRASAIGLGPYAVAYSALLLVDMRLLLFW